MRALIAVSGSDPAQMTHHIYGIENCVRRGWRTCYFTIGAGGLLILWISADLLHEGACAPTLLMFQVGGEMSNFQVKSVTSHLNDPRIHEVGYTY